MPDSSETPRLTTDLTYGDGMLRQAMALGHLGALRELLPLYQMAYEADPARFKREPSPEELLVALATVGCAIRSLEIRDFRRDMPDSRQARGGAHA